jgi:hypothetical protein
MKQFFPRPRGLRPVLIKVRMAEHRWLTPVILAIQEAEIGRIPVQGPSVQLVAISQKHLP